MENLVEVLVEDGFHLVRYNGRTYHKARNAEQAAILSRRLAANVEASLMSSGAAIGAGTKAATFWDTRGFARQGGTVVSFREHAAPILRALGVRV